MLFLELGELSALSVRVVVALWVEVVLEFGNRSFYGERFVVMEFEGTAREPGFVQEPSESRSESGESFLGLLANTLPGQFRMRLT